MIQEGVLIKSDRKPVSKWLKIKENFLADILKVKWETWSKAQQEAGLRCCYEVCFSPLSLLPSAAFVPLEGHVESQQLRSTASVVAWQRKARSHSSLIMQTLLLCCRGPLAMSAPIIVGSGSGLHSAPWDLMSHLDHTDWKQEGGRGDRWAPWMAWLRSKCWAAKTAYKTHTCIFRTCFMLVF